MTACVPLPVAVPAMLPVPGGIRSRSLDRVAHLAAQVTGLPVVVVVTEEEHTRHAGLHAPPEWRGEADDLGAWLAGMLDEPCLASSSPAATSRLRLLATVPMLTADGRRIGMMGVADCGERRGLDEEQRCRLEHLAGLTVALHPRDKSPSGGTTGACLSALTDSTPATADPVPGPPAPGAASGEALH